MLGSCQNFTHSPFVAEVNVTPHPPFFLLLLLVWDDIRLADPMMEDMCVHVPVYVHLGVLCT